MGLRRYFKSVRAANTYSELTHNFHKISVFVVYAGTVSLDCADESAKFNVCRVYLICVEVVYRIEVAKQRDGVVALGSVLGVDDNLALFELLDVGDNVLETLLSFNAFSYSLRPSASLSLNITMCFIIFFTFH